VREGFEVGVIRLSKPLSLVRICARDPFECAKLQDRLVVVAICSDRWSRHGVLRNRLVSGSLYTVLTTNGSVQRAFARVRTSHVELILRSR